MNRRRVSRPAVRAAWVLLVAGSCTSLPALEQGAPPEFVGATYVSPSLIEEGAITRVLAGTDQVWVSGGRRSAGLARWFAACLDLDGRTIWEWESSLRHSTAPAPESLVAAPGGGVFLCGEALGARIIYLDREGQAAWERTVTPPETRAAGQVSLVALSSGGVAVAGTAWRSDYRGPGHPWAAGLDASGTVLWNRVYGSDWSTQGGLYSLAATEGGRLIACGRDFSRRQPLILVLGPDGELIERTLSPFPDAGWIVASPGRNGDVLLAGWAGLYPGIRSIVARLDAAGGVLWRREGSTAELGTSVPRAIAENALGHIGIVMTAPDVVSGEAAYLEVLSAAGELLWSRRRRGAVLGPAWADAVTASECGEWLLAGGAADFWGGYSPFLAAYDAQGEPAWERVLDEDPLQQGTAYAIGAPPGGRLFLCGASTLFLPSRGTVWRFHPVLAPPDPPANLTGTPITETSAKFTWSDTAGETGYRIENAALPGGSFIPVGTTGPGEVTFTITSPEPGGFLHCRVVAHNRLGESPSAVVSLALPPAAPGELGVPRVVRLGRVPVGQEAARSLVLRNTSRDSPLWIRIEGVEHRGVSVSPSGTLLLEPRQRVEVPLRFAPGRRGPVRATLIVRSGDPHRRETRILLSGSGR